MSIPVIIQLSRWSTLRTLSSFGILALTLRTLATALLARAFSSSAASAASFALALPLRPLGVQCSPHGHCDGGVAAQSGTSGVIDTVEGPDATTATASTLLALRVKMGSKVYMGQ